MAAILKSDPPELRSVEPPMPPALARIVERCLEKAPVGRFQSASDLAFALGALSQSSSASAAAQQAPSAGTRRWSTAVVATLAAVVAAAVTFSAVVLLRDTATTPTAAITARFPVFPPDGTLYSTNSTNRARFAVSPDGRQLAFVAETSGVTNMWVRALDSTTARQIPGTAEVRGAPIWSPDSRSLAFFSNGKLRRADFTGAPPQPIADTPGLISLAATVGGSWSPDGTIVFATAANNPIFGVSINGGMAAPVTRVVAGNLESHDLPSFLPDGRHFVFTSRGVPAREGVWIGDVGGADPVRLIDRATQAHFSHGYLLFIRDGVLQARPFDSARNELSHDQSGSRRSAPTACSAFHRPVSWSM